MALSIRDKATDAAVRRLAALKRKGLTETIREAVENELRRTKEAIPLVERLKSLGDEYAKYPKTGEKADKAFYDDLGDNL
jgi:antitoxin VapB